MIPSMYSNTILTDSPLAYYRLGEISGTTAYDSSGHVKDGTINGGVTLGISGLLSKDRDTAMTFDGSSGYITLPTSGLPTGASAWTIECWIKMPTTLPTSGSGFNAAVAIGTNASGQIAWMYYRTTSQVFRLDTANNNINSTNTAVPGGVYHLVGTYDGTTITFYVNGVSQGTYTSTLNLTFGTAQIGNDNSGDFWAGIIDEVAIYGTALSLARVQAHYNAGINTAITSSQDTFLNKWQVVKVYDPSGNFLGTIDDANYITAVKDTINAASDAIHIILPRAIDAYDGANQPGSAGTIAMGNNIQIWMYGAGIASSGVLRFNGIIDTITPKLDENGGQSVDVLCTPYSQLALGDHGVTTTLSIGTSGTSSTYIDTGVMFSQFFTGSYVNSAGTTVSTVDAITGKPYGDPYTMDPTSASVTTQKSQFSFQNQTVLSAASNVLLLSPPNFFFRMNPNKTVYFGQIPNTPTYTLLLGQHITSIEFPQDNVPRKNLIVIQGNGTVKGTYTGSSVSTLGQRVYFKNDNRITDANTAQQLANGIGALLDQTVIRAKLKIPDYRGDVQSGLGFDIEKFQVGETVKIIDARAPASSATGAGSVWGGFVWGQGKWGAASAGTPTIWGSFNWGQATWGTSLGVVFQTVLPIMAITRHFHYCELEIGFRAPSINKKIFDIEAKLADATLLG